ncbi:hypothetical protein, partial [Acidiphilium sp.]|uniref:hypothetical protein n=1 Tax=Acidiphilium sp. TaxID=527 RepID=UPI003CFBE772
WVSRSLKPETFMHRRAAASARDRTQIGAVAGYSLAKPALCHKICLCYRDMQFCNTVPHSPSLPSVRAKSA